MATKKKTSRNMRQEPLPGQELPVHKDIQKAAEDYLDRLDESWDARESFDKAKDKLRDVMKQHKLPTYTDPHTRITVTITEGEEKIKVKRLRSDAEADEGAE